MAVETDHRAIETEIGGLRFTPDPMIIVTDFGNHLSPAECEIAMGKIIRSRGLAYEPPHGIHDVEGFDFTDGGYQVRQVAIDYDRELAAYDRVRAVVDPKPAVIGTVVDPGVGTNRRIVVVETLSGNRYVGPDNSVLDPALTREEVTSAYAVNDDVYEKIAATFHGRDLILPTVARLASGDNPAEMDYLHSIDPSTLAKRELQDNMVVHVDGYGGKPGAPDYGGNVKFEGEGLPHNGQGQLPDSVTLTLPKRVLYGGLSRKKIKDVTVGRTFDDVGHMQPIVYPGSSGEQSGDGRGHLELAIRGGKGRRSAGGRFDLYPGDQVGFDWHYRNQEQAGSRGTVFPGRLRRFSRGSRRKAA